MFAGPLGRSTFTPPKSSFDSPLYGLVSLRRSHLRKIRFEHKTKTQPGKGKPEKTFRWEHREAGRWWFGKGDKDTPLYVNATFRKRDQAGIVVGFEGEAKADVAGDLGFSAFSYKDGLSETSVGVLSGCEVALWPDKDEAGTNYALNSAETISKHGQVRSLTIIEPHENLPEGGDIVDAVQTLGCGTEEISSLIDSAVPYAQSPRKKEQQAVTWPRPQPIASELPPVQPFREELLPSSFRALVQDVANRMQVPLDYPAAIAVLCLAGAVNRRARIQPKANDPSWLVVPNLWGGIVAPPGMLKSPLITCITKPLTDIQAGWHEEHKEDLARYEQEHEEWTLRQQAWKEEFKRLTKKHETLPEKPSDQPQAPLLRRLVVNDSTFEALHVTMSKNPAGILVVRDEITGWWSMLDRPGREGERAFCLQAWNGDTGHTVDRIGRGTIHVEACCMSTLRGIQPGRLRAYLTDALSDGPSNDGLIQRFQILVWPDMGDWKLVDQPPDTVARDQFSSVLGRILDLSVDHPLTLKFSHDAQALFNDWLTELENKLRSGELHPAFVSHLSKYRSLMPSLALLFEVADATKAGYEAESVSLEHTQQAAAWCDCLESHAHRIYSCVTTPQLRAARELANKLKTKILPEVFSCREVYLKGWSGLDSPQAAREAAEVLRDADWLRQLPGESTPVGGRPPERYEVNPRVWE